MMAPGLVRVGFFPLIMRMPLRPGIILLRRKVVPLILKLIGLLLQRLTVPSLPGSLRASY